MKFQIRKEHTVNGWFFFAYEWGGISWEKMPGALVYSGGNDVEDIEKCKANIVSLKFPEQSVVREFELNEDGAIVSPTEGL